MNADHAARWVRVLGVVTVAGGLGNVLAGSPAVFDPWGPVVFPLLGLMCLVAGTGLLLLKEWGRWWALRCCVCCLVVLVGVAIELVDYGVALRDAGMDGAVVLGLVVMAVVGGASGLLGLIWVLRHPDMRGYFR